MKGVLLSVLAGALLMLVGGCTAGSTAALSPPVVASSSAGAGYLQGALATHQTRGQKTTLHLHLRADIVWPEAALLEFHGIRRWRIHIPHDSAGLPEGVGSCAGPGDEVPFLLREGATGTTYVQMPPYTDCIVDLTITPVRKGHFPLSVSVLERSVADQEGFRVLPLGKYTTPYRLTRTIAVRGLLLRWQVHVTG